ncbi:MAG: phenylalanine--tRNA ligase subunit beta [Thermoproteota archaeon]
MPVSTLYRDRFSKFVGQYLTIEEMEQVLPWIGCDIEERGIDYLKVEFNPNRIDFSSYAGIARAFQGIKKWKKGIPRYPVHKSDIILKIDESVQEVRPYMLSAVVKDIQLDGAAVKELMEIQEDLHWGIGRDRKKASIGVHDLDRVTPPLTYLAANPEETKFIPLNKREEMTLQEILQKHEKGRAYSHLIDWASKYPLLIDKKGRALSMPPIINSQLTKIEPRTKNLFLDVTGPDIKAVEQSLNVLATALADMGGTIQTVEVKYPDRTIVSPKLTSQKMKLRPSYVNKLLGLKLTEEKIIECLEKCRLKTKKIKGEALEVEIPAYRIDILHEVDLVEEVAIGYGYYRLKPTRPETVTTGSLHETSRLGNLIRQTMIGLGFTEVMNFMLTNEDLQYKKMKIKPGEHIRIENPSSSEYNIGRTKLLPSLMKNLKDNRHRSFPQRIFEISDVIQVNMEEECQSQRIRHLSGVSSHPTASFTEIKSTGEALLTDLGFSVWKMKPKTHPSCIEGRVATINLNNRNIGFLGEIHPQVLNNFELENPVVGFEINIEKLTG